MLTAMMTSPPLPTHNPPPASEAGQAQDQLPQSTASNPSRCRGTLAVGCRRNRTFATSQQARRLGSHRRRRIHLRLGRAEARARRPAQEEEEG